MCGSFVLSVRVNVLFICVHANALYLFVCVRLFCLFVHANVLFVCMCEYFASFYVYVLACAPCYFCICPLSALVCSLLCLAVCIYVCMHVPYVSTRASTYVYSY